MWDIKDILLCPYCYSKLSELRCLECGRQYYQKNDMTYMFDVEAEHWQKCQAQIKALLRLEYDDSWTPRHDSLGYPYDNVEIGGLGQKANAAMFNIAKELMSENLLSAGYALDIGAYNGWASFRLAEHKKTVALDSSDHPCYGLGSVPSVGYGIQKVIGDGCYLPFTDDTFDIIIMVSALHHMHDKVKLLNEAHRVLSLNGTLVTIGDRPMSESNIEAIKQDGIRDYEGEPYIEPELWEWFRLSAFDNLKLVHTKYCDGMECMGASELVTEEPGDNAIIVGVKS